MKPLVAIVGPTAVGKTSLALSLARVLDSEIVNADSRQVYRYMDIGTAKPTPEEQKSVPHHIIDILDPDENFNLALYQKLAYDAIDDIQKKGNLPLLVGGSGLYVWSVLEGWQIPEVPPDPEFRLRLEERAAGEGVESLYQELQQIDPAAAEKIDKHNLRRVIRALEVCQRNGSFSRYQQKKPPEYKILILGLTTDREELYRRIDRRVDNMIEQGLIEEVRKLMGRGYDLSLPAMSSVGYWQIGGYLKGEIDLPAAIRQTKFDTHRFARHQYAWFRLKDHRIRWFESTEPAIETFSDFVKGAM